ncbi:MAG TPA: hypothetical protein PKY27_05585 [Arachnia sp.]|nr:hypothetical protein [Arachnia sp.]HQD21709.1 hypothetical protein [Arachnia sp.]
MNERLTDDLLGLVPDRPDPSGWGPRVRRRSGRRRALAGGAATALVIGVAVALSTTLGGAGPNVAVPGPSSPTATGPTGPDPTAPETDPPHPHPHPSLPDDLAEPVGLLPGVCAALLESRLEASEPPRAGLSTGATRVWLCGDPESAIAGEGQIGPREPLTADPDRVADAYNRLPAADTSQGCDGDAGLVYRVIVEYPDRWVAFTGNAANCQAVGDRKGGDAFVKDLTAMWLTQREASPSEFAGAEGLCRVSDEPYSDAYGAHTSFLVDVAREDVKSGALCGTKGYGERLWVAGGAPLPDEVVAEPSTARLDPAPVGADPAIGESFLVLLNAFGDPVTYHLGIDGGVWVRGDEQVEFLGIWRPSEAVKDQWDATLEAAGVVPG